MLIDQPNQTKLDQPMHQYLINCTEFDEYLKFYTLSNIDTFNAIVSKEICLHDAVMKNTELLNHNDKWTQLQYLNPFT